MRVQTKWLAVLAVAILASCSSGGSSNPTTYTVGGTVTGLAGTGLVLRNNGGNDLPVAANGAFTFGTALASGSAYAVTVATQPTSPAQLCTVTSGTGTVGSTNVTDVAVSCATAPTHTVGGTVTGLLGSGLVLQNNGGDNLAVSATGAFTFSTPVVSGGAYAVAVLTQPTSPAQICTVASGSGTVGTGNVTDVAVTCASQAFTVGGTVSGLTGAGLVLRNNGGNDLAVSASGAFAFTGSVASGGSYAVTVFSQPASQSCTVTNGTGTVTNANVTSVVVTCGSTASYTVGGTVAGLAGTGLVLRNNGGTGLPVSGNGTFTFPGTIVSGGSYAVTVLTQPTSPAQSCAVTNGVGTVAGANVTNITVTCVNIYTVGGNVSGLAGSGLVLQNNGGGDLPVSATGGFTFGTPTSSGTAYNVTVRTQPTSPTQICTVTNGVGTVGTANVTNVAVTCVTNSHTLGGTVTGLDGTGLVLRNTVGGATTDAAITGDGPYAFTTPVATGATYAVTVQTQPTNPAQVCTVSSGGTGTMGTSDVANVVVTCPSTIQVLQTWQVPTTWGGTTSFWSDGEPGMVEHLTFTPALHEGGAITWGSPNGAPRTDNALTGVGNPAVTRFSAGPFNLASPGPRYVATSGDSALDIQGDMLVCAVVKPDWNPIIPQADDKIIFSKGVRGQSGWVLHQSLIFFSFRYQSSTGEKVAFTETDFSMPQSNPQGPLNPSYVVLCAGRDTASGSIAMVANGWNSSKVTAVDASDTLVPSADAATVGGYFQDAAAHDYGGRVYETAVWKIPATRANIEAKMAPILGLLMPGSASAATYLRDREGYYPGAGGAAPYHTAWKHQPRIDPTGKGFLFGLQATNRVPYPEALELWTPAPASGVAAPTVTANSIAPPGDADVANAARILLPPGSSISVLLGNFGDAGALHGQVWLQRVSPTGTLTIASDTPGTPAPVSQGSQDVDLAPLTTWTQVQITGLTTDGAALPAGAGTLRLTNTTASPIEFYAWGVTLTQLGRDLGGGGVVAPLGFNPGPTIYSSLVPQAAREVLTLPVLGRSTADTGFCIGAQGQPADGMSWAGPFSDRRTLVEWLGASASGSAKIVVTEGHALRFVVTSGLTSKAIDAAIPGSLTPGNAAWIKGCVTSSGAMTLYADDVSIGTDNLGVAPVNLAGGSLSVGSDHSGTEPWQGYVKAAAACRNNGAVADCK